MFEKSLYDLIRGLRNHKGDEIEYIQSSIKECRAEVRSQDMDVKGTALLKLTYLEMFGYDMSWASFHVLEVMSSTKYAQKRVGYLGAVQSFRPDTEVLMLATNLLKKDLTSASIPTMSLPLLTIPHIITPSLALSLLSDLLPRLSHSQPAVRKKTVVTLYRLALVYPEALRVSWPKIKERLMDDTEDSSVTAAIINVVCELGWRRPQDFLPLAPKFFDLLVDGGNNWMAIKIVKLFATLTPLEPRLVKKLLRPLTNIIQTTSAMSLLYECINGVIQGGILDGAEGNKEGDEIADLCVSKLRGMIAVEGDPNLKYVALLAFNRIVTSHPHLVSLQQDVIMDCLDDPDISIRLQALDLVSGMVDSDSLQDVVLRLMKQLQSSPLLPDEPLNDHGAIEPAADSEGENPEEKLDLSEKRSEKAPPLPNDYRTDVIRRILAICSKDTYANIVDFEWYVEIMVQLVRVIPPSSGHESLAQPPGDSIDANSVDTHDVAYQIGSELRNVAVRVKSVRLEATRAAESLVLVNLRPSLFPQHGGAEGVLGPVVWIVGEYSQDLAYPSDTLNSLIHSTSLTLPPATLSIYLQAIPKVFILLSCDEGIPWEAVRKTTISLLLARIVHFLENLAAHPSLEVQERSIEFLELLRLAGEAVASAEAPAERPPLFLTTALINLFSGMELNPVSSGAQKKVPRPTNIDLDVALNEKLSMLLQMSDGDWLESDLDESESFYSVREIQQKGKAIPITQVEETQPQASSYQNMDETLEDPRLLAKRKAERRAERRERNKDDPFYIANDDLSSGRSTPFHDILKNSNGEDLDVDAIPIMDLNLGSRSRDISPYISEAETRKKRPKARRVEIARDETLELGDTDDSQAGSHRLVQPAATRTKKSLLQVDSSGLGSFSIEGQGDGDLQLDIERREAEEAEMAKAMAEVERLRLEMQRASERIEIAQDVPPDGTLVKRKKKKKPASVLPAFEPGEASGVGGEASVAVGSGEIGEVVEKIKKKRKKKVKEPLPEET